MRVIGLMSGTSADAVDAVLVDWPEEEAVRPFRLEAAIEERLEPELRGRIHRLAAGELSGADVLPEVAALDVLLGRRFADAAVAVARSAGVPLDEVAAIASHGQTIAHHPELGSSIQIGSACLIAERTGCRVVADFRSRDLAAGGEGAPLAPFFHWAAISDPAESRAVLNLGGIANLTWLPAGGRGEDVLAFDVGPANSLVDGVIALASGGREGMDRDGARARRGRVVSALLSELLDDEFLARPPPKSTGRERYGSARAAALQQRAAREGIALDDLVATLTAFSVEAVARACRDFLPSSLGRLLVGGGGVRNPAVMAGLAGAFPEAAVEPLDAVGVPADAAEAIAFSLLGRNTLLGLPNHLPGTTGARRAAVLGAVVPGRAGRL